jgi:hypothetical protein
MTCKFTSGAKFTLVPVKTDTVVWALNALGAVAVWFSAHVAPITRPVGASVAKGACLAANLLYVRFSTVRALRTCAVDAKVGCVVFLVTRETFHLQNVRRATWRTEGTAPVLAGISGRAQLATCLLIIGFFAVATGCTKASIPRAEFIAKTIVAPIGKQPRVWLLAWRATSAVNPGVRGVLYVVAEPAF